MPAALALFLSDQLTLAAVAVMLLALAAVALLAGRRTPWQARLRRTPLLMPNEAEFFHRLQRALPGQHVFPQVAFAALLTDDGQLSSKARWAVRARFDRKVADFVICQHGSLHVVALLELDDRTHVARTDRDRDALTKAAGQQTFRFPSKRQPSAAELAALFQHARAWVSG